MSTENLTQDSTVDLLNFDSSSLMERLETPAAQNRGNSLIYRMRPADSKSEDHVYRATIKIVYNPFDPKNSILEQQAYSLQDKDGYFTAVSSLTNNDTSCPIFKAWKQCRFAEPGSALWKQQAKLEDGGKSLFNKRFSRFVVIQVMQDKNQPELVGRFLFWKVPKAVWDLLQSKMNPSKESGKASIPVMDFLFGRSIDIEVTPGPGKPGDERYARDTKYLAELSDECVSCITPEGESLLTTAQQAILDEYVEDMQKVWKTKDPEDRAALKAKVDAKENTLALKKFYQESVIPKIKEVCPNLFEELSYNGWSPELTKRVENWIKIVLACGDPTQEAPEAAATVGQLKAAEAEAPKSSVAPTTASDSDDDLPF